MSDPSPSRNRDWISTWATERASEGERVATRGANDEDGAVFDANRTYRYALWRSWRLTGPRLLVITLNPWLANERNMDHTTRLAREWAQRLGFGSVWIGSLFAYRSPRFRDVKKAKDPIGPGNDWWLSRMHEAADATLVAWGDYGRFLDRGRVVMQQLTPIRPVEAIGGTGSGQPHHLLSMRADTPLAPFPGIPRERVWCRKCQAYIGEADGLGDAKIVQAAHENEHHPARYPYGVRPTVPGRFDHEHPTRTE